MAVMPVLWPGASAAAPVFVANMDPPDRPATSQVPLMARGFVSVDRGVYWLGATPPVGGRRAS